MIKLFVMILEPCSFSATELFGCFMLWDITTSVSLMGAFKNGRMKNYPSRLQIRMLKMKILITL